MSQTEAVDSLQFHGGFMETISTRLLGLEERERKREEKLTNLNSELISTKEELRSVKAEVKQNTKEIKGNNMIINGLKEPVNENCKDTAVDFLKKLVPEVKANDLSNAYRMGKTGGDGEVNRALFIKFHDGDMKTKVMKKKSHLYKNKNLDLKSVFCNDDLSEDCRVVRQEMREIARFARGNGYTDAKVSGDKLHIQGRTYADDELHLLPHSLKLESIRTRQIRNGIGFFSKHSFLSNFHPAPVVINGQSFISSEQAYQFSKAMACNRDNIAESIKARIDPKKMKKDGDKVDTTPEWESRKEEVMRCILTGKFSQNAELQRKLHETGDTKLYECSTNRFWGTGWRLEAPQWQNSTNFPGANTLGKLLMEVRSILGNGSDHVDLFSKMSSTKKNPNTTLQEIREDNEALMEVDKVADNRHQEDNLLSEATGGAGPNEYGDGTKNAPITSSNSVSSSDILEVDSSDSISGDSEVFNRSNFNAKSIMLHDGHLDRDKLLSWVLPTIDNSRLREIAAKNFPTAIYKGKNIGSHSTVSLPMQSTPVSHVSRRKAKKGKKSSSASPALEDKWNILQMLDKVKKN